MEQMTTPVILLHGALGSSAQMSAIQSALDAERPVYNLDLPGHGGIPAEEPFSMDLFGRALLDLLDTKNIAFADLYGYSMGGYIALWFAWKFPERVRLVKTLGTKLDWTPETAAGMVRMFDPEKIEAKAPQLAQHLATVHAPLDWKLLCRQTSDFLQRLGAGAGIPDDAFSRIGCPVHIGRGDADQVVGMEECEKVAALLPDGHLHVLAGVPHGMERGGEVYFLSDVRGEK